MENDPITWLHPDGWVELHLSGISKAQHVLARVEERGDRKVVTRLVIAAEVIDSATLRNVPVGRIESAVNSPEARLGGSVARELANRGVSFPAAKDLANLDEALVNVLKASEQGKTRRHKTVRPRRPPLSRPDGADPDEFSRRVARAYNEAILTTSKPAPVLAQEAGVPVGTVHRWIREARQRGHLPPARKGRAG